MQTKRDVRDHRGQLLTLLNGWDPAGLLEDGGPRNEYDAIVDPLLALLSSGASRGEVAKFLEKEVRERFDTAADGSQFATRAITWFEIASREE